MLVTNVFPPQRGGSGRWFWEIYRRLPRECVVVAAGEDPGAATFDRSHTLRIERLKLAFSTWGIVGGFTQYMTALRRLRQLVRHEGVTEVHCGTLLPEGLLGWLLRRLFNIPYTCFVHGEELNVGGSSRELSWLMRRVLNGAQRVVANSQNTAVQLREGWRVPAEKISVLHPGVDVERFVPAKRDEAKRSKFGWSGRKAILTVGRLQRRKGMDMMIRAMPAILEAEPTAIYTIIGDGEDRDMLESLAKELNVADHVQFQGGADDAELIPRYQQCDLFVLANRTYEGDFEGFGMVLLEAQACGRPVLAGASGGTTETLQPERTGRVVSCDAPEPLAAAVIDLLRDPERLEAWGAAGREWTIERFAWTALAVRATTLFNCPQTSSAVEGSLARAGSQIEQSGNFPAVGAKRGPQ